MRKQLLFLFIFTCTTVDYHALQSIEKWRSGEVHSSRRNEVLDHNKRFVVIVPSYKNAQWYRRNLGSIFMQEYDSYRVIYVDDCSPDGTGDLVDRYVKECGQEHRVTLVRNTQRIKAMANIYKAVYMCDDREIVVMLDGDDWLANKNVFKTLNDYYNNLNVWITYGNFIWFINGVNAVGWGSAISPKVIRDNAFRFFQPGPCHLRTFYAKLFKKIALDDLCEDGEFYEYTYDLAMMFPMLEMAGERSRFINKHLYLYYDTNQISDQRLVTTEQRQTDLRIRVRDRYTRIDSLFEK